MAGAQPRGALGKQTARGKARGKRRGAAAKQKALAARAAAARKKSANNSSNLRRLNRRAAVVALNKLGEDCALNVPALKQKDVDLSRLDQFLRVLNRRCAVEPQRTTFAEAVEKWVANGGKLPDGMRFANAALVEDETAAPARDELPVVPRHKVLAADFRLHSKAFMVTHNSECFSRNSWKAYRKWAVGFAKKFGARAWAACWEKSTHAQNAALKCFTDTPISCWKMVSAFSSRTFRLCTLKAYGLASTSVCNPRARLSGPQRCTGSGMSP